MHLGEGRKEKGGGGKKLVCYQCMAEPNQNNLKKAIAYFADPVNWYGEISWGRKKGGGEGGKKRKK